MNVDIGVMTSVMAVCISLFVALSTNQRHTRKDSQESAIQNGMILEKLANISLGIADLKDNFGALSKDQKELRERVAKLEMSNKTLRDLTESMFAQLEELKASK